MLAAIFPVLVLVGDFQRVVGFEEAALEQDEVKVLARVERAGKSLESWFVCAETV
jgi:hypothetical protein